VNSAAVTSSLDLPKMPSHRLSRTLRNFVPTWSKPAALRSVRAAAVVSGLFALSSKVIGNPQVATFAAFGGFATLVLASFGGGRRDKLIAHLCLAVAGSVVLVIGTAVNSITWIAALVTIAVAFCVLFAGVASANAASGATALLLAYILPAASPGTISMIPDRLAGWWMASAAGTVAVLALNTRPPTDRLRTSIVHLTAVLSQQLEDAVNGATDSAASDVVMDAKHELLSAFTEVPYRPTGLTVTDQAISDLVESLEWCATSAIQAIGIGDFDDAQSADRAMLRQSAMSLKLTAGLIKEGKTAGIEDVLRDLDTSLAQHKEFANRTIDTEDLHLAFHARLVAAAAHRVMADALIAVKRAQPAALAEKTSAWWGQQVIADSEVERYTVFRAVVNVVRGHASLRSIWFVNSVRGAVALAAAVAIADGTNVQHGFWVVLGALSVLRTSAASTGATALRALSGTVVGFAIGAAILLAIGHHASVLWAVLPIAILVAGYTPGTAPFAVGQAAFTVTIAVLYNLIAPVGWKVGELRVEDVAIGVAVSALVGVFFWPRGVTAVVAKDLADAFHSGGVYLVQATAWALGIRREPPDGAARAVAAGNRLDDALRGLLSEQGTKRVPKEDLWRLEGATLRLRLMAYALAREVSPQRVRGEGPRTVMAESVRLAGEYDTLATRLGHMPGTVAEELAGLDLGASDHSNDNGQLVWIRLHLDHLADNLEEIAESARSLADRVDSPWWR
jgi:uncharacterized membrane protein YccC